MFVLLVVLVVLLMALPVSQKERDNKNLAVIYKYINFWTCIWHGYTNTCKRKWERNAMQIATCKRKWERKTIQIATSCGFSWYQTGQGPTIH